MYCLILKKFKIKWFKKVTTDLTGGTILTGENWRKYQDESKTGLKKQVIFKLIQ